MGNVVMTFGGEPGPTTRYVCTNTAQNLSAIYDNSSSRPAIGAIVTAEVNDVRFTLGGALASTYPPTQGASGLGHILYKGQSIQLGSGPTVRTFQFLSHSNNDASVIQVTPLFEKA